MAETETTYSVEPNKRGYISTDYKKLINKIHKLIEENPGEIEVIADDKDNDGCLYCSVPYNLYTISLKRKREYSDEKREELSERLSKARENKRTEI